MIMRFIGKVLAVVVLALAAAGWTAPASAFHGGGFHGGFHGGFGHGFAFRGRGFRGFRGFGRGFAFAGYPYGYYCNPYYYPYGYCGYPYGY
jgi:hypothetical protein